MMVKNTPELYIFTHLTYTFLTNHKLLPDKRLTYFKYKYHCCPDKIPDA